MRPIKKKDQAAPEEAKDSSSTTAQDGDTAARPITMAQYGVCAASTGR